MVLTHQARRTGSYDKFPTSQLFLLAICRVAEPIALTSIFPYSWVMVKDLHMAEGEDASFYAGILIAAFSLAEALTGMFWGGLSDKVGRKPVLISGCLGTMLSLLLVGLAPNFWIALIGRALGGALNGNIGVIQTMVGELVKNPDHEPRAYAVMPFVWSIGTIIGPAIGGLLAKPTETFPSVFAPSGIFGKFPYLLPNLVCSGLLVFSIIGSWFFLEETHPDMQPSYYGEDEGRDAAHPSQQPLLPTGESTIAASMVDTRGESYGTFAHPQLSQKSPPTPSSIFTWRVVMLITALGIFTYHSMTYDHLLPIFLQDANSRHNGSLWDMAGGMGLSTQTVGLIMSTDGIIALVIQTVIFPALAQALGVWKLFVVVTVLHPLTYFIVPFLIFLPSSLTLYGIYACLVIRNILSIIDYPVLLILIKQASPSDSVMGKVNGLAASVGAASRTAAPPVAGYLYSTGSKLHCTAIAWWGSTIVALIGALQLWFIDRKKDASTVSALQSTDWALAEAMAQKEEMLCLLDSEASANTEYQS
ncbi:hypothetical protein ASPZODRAFT_66988 [Penicilliopsis zonata CBS 506.65]|uniref:Major facilitator superfamily (MFS) profile domain-containing protein n=1 Tax=Penicilliopsis zonata CBS 506.65 TaxID=1073090 RepID=A0A1L9SGD8_9EURO|nr:hypothetical protein ASPZODRAFT_66988 [Penicilliopsis zonata CBS 506.65]OJJ46300.1 hypothetical protein ASPZODRAFT_66988 [Penicilliopsis zonata CBS 506.65]